MNYIDRGFPVYIPRVLLETNLALVRMKAWRRSGDRQLFVLVLVWFTDAMICRSA